MTSIALAASDGIAKPREIVLTGAAHGGGRNNVLDAFRAILIGNVLFYHYLVCWAPPTFPANLFGYSKTYSPYWDLGRLGVHVFFVISGIVIALTLTRSRSVIEFAARRIARIYPCYLLTMLLTFFAMRWFGLDIFRRSYHDLLLGLTMTPQNLKAEYIDPSYWSLAVEAKFYFLIAIARLCLGLRFWMGMVAIGILGTLLSPFALGVADAVFIFRYMPLFLIGISIWFSLFHLNKPAAGWTGGVGVVLLLVNAPHLVPAGWTGVLDYAYIFFLIATMVLLLRLWPTVPLGPLPYLGRISYSLYLVHQCIGVTIIAFLTHHAGAPDLVACGVAMAVCVGLSSALYHMVELPAQGMIMAAYRRSSFNLKVPANLRQSPESSP